MFLVNLFEIAFLFSAVFVLSDCLPEPKPAGQLIYESISSVFRIDIFRTKSFWYCNLIASYEQIVAATLLTVVVASLIGAVVRPKEEEQAPPSENQVGNVPSPYERIIATGQAYVRILEGVDVLLERNPAWTERLLLKLVRSLYTHRLRRLFATLPGDVTDEILKASERVRVAALTVGMN